MKVNNIFHNDFYDRQVMPSWSWEASIVSKDPNVSQDTMVLFQNAVTQVEIPDLQMQTVQTQFRGLTFDFPTRLDNTGELSIRFNENSTLSLYRTMKQYLLLTSWNQSYVQDDSSDAFEPKGMLVYIPFDIYVKLFSPALGNEERYKFIFRNCFVMDISDVEMAYDSEECMEYTVKFHYNFRLEGDDADEFFGQIDTQSR